MQRNLIVLGFGLLVGAAIGFYMGWFVLPAELVDVSPADLETEFQADYLRLIASTYAADQDLNAAASRIGSLGRQDWPQWLREEAVNQVIGDPTGIETAHMVGLARAMGIESPAFDQAIPPTPTAEPEVSQ